MFQTTPGYLPTGTYRPYLTGGASWRIAKWNDLTSSDVAFDGYVRMDVVEKQVFGNEVIKSSFVRGYDFSGQYSGVPNDQDFDTFYVPGNNGSQYFLRITAYAGNCSKATLINAGVVLVAQ